jgi:hypothetical protein
VRSTSRSTLKSSVASGVLQQAGFAKLLRLVFDTAALRERGIHAASPIYRERRMFYARSFNLLQLFCRRFYSWLFAAVDWGAHTPSRA